MNRDAAPTAPALVVGCGGDGCDARDPWPLHHVRHRSVFCRLCTSCVLRYHPGSFCSACFDVFPSAAAAPGGGPGGLVRCAKCPAVAHLACLPGGGASYLCPACSSPKGFAYSPAPTLSKTHHNVIDLPSSKVLFAAAQISSLSMSRASTAVRAEAERKAREAAFAKKRARDMLEEAVSVCIKEKEKRKESVGALAVTVVNASSANVSPILAKAAEPKKKAVRISGGAAADATAAKKFQDRQREKLMRFQEPIQVVTPIQMMAYQPPARIEANKVLAVNNVQNRVVTDARGMDTNLAQPNSNIAKMEKETRGLLLSSQDATVPKMGEIDKGRRITKPTQDGSVSRMDNRAIVTVPPDTAGLHS